MAQVRAFIAIGVDAVIRARLADLQAVWRKVEADIAWVPNGEPASDAQISRRCCRRRLAGSRDTPDAGGRGAGALQHHACGERRLSEFITPAPRCCGWASATGQRHCKPWRKRSMWRWRRWASLGNSGHIAPISRWGGYIRWRIFPGCSCDRRASARQFGTMRVSELRLMRSDLASRGARYTVLHTAALTGAIPPAEHAGGDVAAQQ